MSRKRGMQICYGAEVGLGRMTAHALGRRNRVRPLDPLLTPRADIPSWGGLAERRTGAYCG